MTTLDIVLILVVVASAIYGYYKGLLSQMGALAGVLVGIVCCRIFAEDLAMLLNEYLLDSTSSKSSRFLNSVIAQVVLFLAGYFGARWVASLLTTILKSIKLGVVNRLAGAIFAVVQGLVLLSLVINLWIAIFPDGELMKTSTGVLDEHLINLAPDIFGSETAKEFLEASKELTE